MAFIYYDPIVLLQITQVRWVFPHLLLGDYINWWDLGKT